MTRRQILKHIKEVCACNDGVFEHYPEDFIEGRTSYDEVKDIATAFYYALKTAEEYIQKLKKSKRKYSL